MSQNLNLWERYKRHLCVVDTVGLRVDISRMSFADDFFESHAAAMSRALDAMEALELGAIANPDENRMVGHYWLRAPERAPEADLTKAIIGALTQVKRFAERVHAGELKPQKAARFSNLLVIGIGGSALGPQLAADALTSEHDRLRPFFFDNTDPDGMDRTLAQIGAGLSETLVVVISKSGGTKETRNGMLEAQRAFERAGLSFAKHAVAVTGDGSELHRYATTHGWLELFPMWDWVGGRTSELSAVGLLPAALQGLDIDGMLQGARLMDEATRVREVAKNPAALLALMWLHGSGGAGQKDLVVLPYKDRLLLLSRYLQQLVMESLGKEKDLDGRVVNQGLAVYGNKGSTDQHAYVQQLREGVNNFFVTFIQTLKDREGRSQQVEADVTSGDFLLGFFLGTRQALYDNGRQSITLTLPDVSARSLGALIALFERAVGLYASLINVNAYHQPGVEAGKKAATEIIEVQRRLLGALRSRPGGRTAEELAKEIGAQKDVETVFTVLEHLAANGNHGVHRTSGARVLEARYENGGEIMNDNPLVKMQQLGQSPWHDNIRRDLLTSGKLKKMIDAGDITGLTSNPTIFEQAISKSTDYDAALKALAKAGKSAGDIFEALAVEDIQHAADLFKPIFDRTKGEDGYVSIEVSPVLAADTKATLEEARRLWKRVARPNLMVKIPATPAGVPAIEECIYEGMNINVTLIFSLERYDAVIDAYLKGLERRHQEGKQVTGISSVASFFISRVDSAIDKQLEERIKAGAKNAEELEALKGKAAIANAQLAYKLFGARFNSAQFAPLAKAGARKQRPLWASTSTKNPKYPDVYYVEALIGPDTVDTMPPATIDAYRDHGKPEVRIDRGVEQAQAVIAKLEAEGILMSKVTHTLEEEGVSSFAASFQSLLAAVDERRKAAAA